MIRFLMLLLLSSSVYAEKAKEVSSDSGEITIDNGDEKKSYPASRFKIVEKDSKCTMIKNTVKCPKPKTCPRVSCPKQEPCAKCPDCPVVKNDPPKDPRKNRVFMMVGYGPDKLKHTQEEDTVIVSGDKGAVVGVGYSRYLFENVDVGVGVMSNATAFGSIGFNF